MTLSYRVRCIDLSLNGNLAFRKLLCRGREERRFVDLKGKSILPITIVVVAGARAAEDRCSAEGGRIVCVQSIVAHRCNRERVRFDEFRPKTSASQFRGSPLQ